MRKTKKRFLSALLACAMLISLFPFAAFAADTSVNNPSELESAIASAEDGDTITLAAGTYDFTTSPLIIEKRVNLVGAGADQTTIVGQVQYKFSKDQNGETLTVSNLTIKPNATTDVQGLQFRGDVPNNGYNLNIVVENCVFDNWKYGITMNSHANGYDLTVKNCRFPSTLCAVSFNYDIKTVGQMADNSVVFDGTNTIDEGCYAVEQFNNDTTPENDSCFETVEDYNNGTPVANKPTFVTNAVAKIGNVFYSNLQDAVTASGTTVSTIDLINDITLTKGISVPTGANITVNGNSHTINYEAAVGSAFGNQTTPITSDTTLNVNGVNFKITDVTGTPVTGFGILVGENTNGVAVNVEGCTFNNVYAGVYFGHFEGTNKGTLSIKNTTYNNSVYAYSIDEVSTGATIDAVTTTTEGNTLNGAKESETWPNVEAYVTRNGVTTVAKSFADAVNNAQAGDVITLAKDLDSTTAITLPAGVTLDGNGYALTYKNETGSLTNGAFITTSGKDVTVKNITINADNIKHGVQFYCCDGGALENAIVNGGEWTAVMVNGATNVTIADSTLNPGEKAYTNIEYAMGGGVTTIPSMSIDNVSFDGTKPYVWADKDTTGRVDAAMSGDQSNDEVLAKILDNITYTNDNGGRLEITVGFADGTTTGSVESTYQPPYTGKYSYEITVADTDNGTVSVDKYATEGEDVTITVTPDKGYKLDELTVTAGSKDVDVKDNGNGTYTFTMPNSKVKVAATFVEDENYDDSITISMTVGSNDFVINDTIVTIPDAAPYIANSRTYVPFRALGEAIGADVVWDNDARTVTYTLDGNEIVMTIGSTTYTVNGVEKTMDVAPEITGERTYVPIRFIGEALGFKVTPLYAEDGTTASVVFEK